LCQKTSLILWRKFYQLEPDGDFLAWACRVAYLEVRNFRRTAARDRLYFSDELLAYLAEDRMADLPNTSHRLTALRGCVKQLDPQQQELLEKAYSSEYSIAQLAERLGQATQTVYNRLFRLRRLLFDCVERRLSAEGQS
jgi:RNA polymerase sigma-70 factor (ECF subfamily)